MPLLKTILPPMDSSSAETLSLAVGHIPYSVALSDRDLHQAGSRGRSVLSYVVVTSKCSPVADCRKLNVSLRRDDGDGLPSKSAEL